MQMNIIQCDADEYYSVFYSNVVIQPSYLTQIQSVKGSTMDYNI